MASSSSSSSSPPSSSSSPSCEYAPAPVTPVRYISASRPFVPDTPCRPFRVITPASVRHHTKRKRELLEAGPPGAREAAVACEPLLPTTPAGSTVGPTGKLKAKPPSSYNDSQELLSALHMTCLEVDEVDFSGSYTIAACDAGTISDKQRVQIITHDIWKATGYRFTVKDHPPSDTGHKTRLWCSQDAARRSKHRGPERVSKVGALFAKPRYACRSRLMIACVPDADGSAARVVTVRMHHYLRHETYEAGEMHETNEAPPMPATPPPTTQFFRAITAPLPPHLLAPPPPPPQALGPQEGEWAEAECEAEPSYHPQPESPYSPDPAPAFAPAPSPVLPPDPRATSTSTLNRPTCSPTPPCSLHPRNATPLPPAEFARRMHAHIARIRDFCDGLEFQVQFGDVRMLAALERDAAPFLALVGGCLAQEGR
ncbi:hypothetical protein B0H10DRAFT_2232640 [Mycena sp. CBHHK59/15]|nr:hypothetical protein B0H10DRAFT_2232640 [Mycena sp. CBHHK59/15]